MSGHRNFYEKKSSNEKGSPSNFTSSVYRLRIMKWKFVICLFVDEETNGSYPFANGLNGPD
jgi:hypothetical protein